MADLHIRRDGRAGRITLTRGVALNALSHEMCRALDAVLLDWAEDDQIALIIIDAEGDKAFCAGGDIADIHATGSAGNFDYARQFWADEYRMNARIAEYRKPVVAFMQGFVMGGGVGVGCHASHRVVGESTRIAMPECGIGLIPDVGGTYLLARAPGQIGAYLGLTGARMGPGDAIFAGFADLFLPLQGWEAMKETLAQTGDVALLRRAAPPDAPLSAHRDQIDRCFGAPDLAAISSALAAEPDEFAVQTLKALRRNSPLSMACALRLQRTQDATRTIRAALVQEYRFTWRALGQSDFLEGIRAAIIDKDKSPRWRHASPEAVTPTEVAAMLAPLNGEDLTFETLAEGRT